MGEHLYPLAIVAVGVLTVLGLIVGARLNAFLALITAALVVSLMAPGEWSEKIPRVAEAFGGTAAEIGIVIALAAVIGRAMMDSGAADRVVRAFLSALGEKRGGTSLMGAGFVLSVPVFFDTVFYLLVPLARSMYKRVGHSYLKFLMAIAAGGAITHTLVPPTPGPLVIASNLGVDLGLMILVGAVAAVPSAMVGMLYAGWLDRRMDVPLRDIGEGSAAAEPLPDEKLPSIGLALLPVLLPVVLISSHTVLETYADAEHKARLSVGDITDWPGWRTRLREQAAREGPSPADRLKATLPEKTWSTLVSEGRLETSQRRSVVDALNRHVLASPAFHDEAAFADVSLPSAAKELVRKDPREMALAERERRNRFLLEEAYPGVKAHRWWTPRRRAAWLSGIAGNANLALLLAAAVALIVYWRQRRPGRAGLAQLVESGLMSGGLIILITAAGGAFGAMLEAAQVGEAIKGLFGAEAASGALMLAMAFGVACLVKVAQGSSTVAMITTSGMLAAMVSDATLGFHPVYLATAIGSGSLVGSWMNDSGFWIFTKMGGLTELESLKSWTPLLAILGATGMVTTAVLAVVLPLR